ARDLEQVAGVADRLHVGADALDARGVALAHDVDGDHGGQQTDDGHHDHELDEREAAAATTAGDADTHGFPHEVLRMRGTDSTSAAARGSVRGRDVTPESVGE